MYKNDATIEWQELVRLVHYSPETGDFTRLVAVSNRSKEGDLLRGYHSSGYYTINVCGRKFLAHRLAWFYIHRVWPSGEIDHINHVRTDNRLVNLRDVPRIINSRNQKLRSTNKSGYTGVKQLPSGKWEARISTHSGVSILGHFRTLDEAVKARLDAEILYLYHPLHGKSCDKLDYLS